MIVSVLLNLVIIILVIIPMNVGLHDLMVIRLAIVRAILRADQHRGQGGHRESRHCEQCWFPKMLPHVVFLVSRLGVHATAAPTRPQFPAAASLCRRETTRGGRKVPIQPDVS
jgi:hypothetical protein